LPPQAHVLETQGDNDGDGLRGDAALN
jgi:hypothetical protein